MFGLQFHEDWRKILRYSWSVRFIVLAGVFSGCQIALPVFKPFWDVPPEVFAGLMFVSTCAAVVARILAQKQIYSRVVGRG